MDNSSTYHEVRYILSIQSIHRQSGTPIFHGVFETITGQKFEFTTLSELNLMLFEIAGWIDAPIWEVDQFKKG